MRICDAVRVLFIVGIAGGGLSAQHLAEKDEDEIGNKHVKVSIVTWADALHTAARTNIECKGRHEVRFLGRSKVLSNFSFDVGSKTGGECSVGQKNKKFAMKRIDPGATTQFNLPATLRNAFKKNPSATFAVGGVDVLVSAGAGFGAEAATTWTLDGNVCDVQGFVRQWGYGQGKISVSPLSALIVSVGVEATVDLLDRKATLDVTDTANGLAHVDIKLKRLAWRLLVKLFVEIGGAGGPHTEFLTLIDREGGERLRTLL